MNNFRITAKARHLRFIYFVEHDILFEDLLFLINLNQQKWGGRYNPIIPVKNNIIGESWKELIKKYDPDYILYSDAINPEIIKDLRFFNPCLYHRVNLKGKRMGLGIAGVNTFHLLSNINPNINMILSKDLWASHNPLLDFYQTNFGIKKNTLFAELQLSSKFKKQYLTKNDENKVIELFYKMDALNTSNLAEWNPNTILLESNQNSDLQTIEFVISKDRNSNEDLFYFWNRMLFEMKEIIFFTLEELDLLITDEYFKLYLNKFYGEKNIKIVSQSLSKEEIKNIIELKLNTLQLPIWFKETTNVEFPFEVNSIKTHEPIYTAQKAIIQTLYSNQGAINIPKVNFIENENVDQYNYAIDLKLEKYSGSNYMWLGWPYSTNTQLFIPHLEGRVNRSRNLSLIINNSHYISDSVNLTIPNFDSLIKQILSEPDIDGIPTRTKYTKIRIEDVGKRLQGMMNLFKDDFSAVGTFSDKFWEEIYIELCKSNKDAGDCILFEKILEDCKNKMKELNIIETDESNKIIQDNSESPLNEYNLVKGLINTLNELCNFRIFIKGFKCKCNKCSSNYWYHLNEVRESINCKGCLEDFVFPIETKFAYKLNDLVKHNIFKKDGNRDGNLTVIRTLAELKSQSNHSFLYSPQLSIYKTDSKEPSCDLDIVCIADGKLIIGEVKYNSIEFSAESNKSLESLALISNTIRPDKIILSCQENPKDKLEKAKYSLTRILSRNNNQVPEIQIIQVTSGYDFDINNPMYFYD